MTVTASNNAATVVVSNDGAVGDTGNVGADGTGLNNIRKSLLDNPLCHLFKTNALSAVSAPLNTDADVTWARSTTATYIDRYGVVKTAAIDTPREEKDGFLFEGASTNEALNSEDFTVWQLLLSASITGNMETAPDGTLTADTLTAGAGSSSIQSFTAGTIGDIFTASFWIKRKTGTGDVYLKAGTNTVSGNLSITNDWVRYSYTGEALTDGNVRAAVVLQTGGDEVYLWGGQVEQLPFASSYIPTTSAAVTRAADLVSVPIRNNFISKALASHTQIFNVKALASTSTMRLWQTSNSLEGRTVFYGLISTGSTFVYRDSTTDNESSVGFDVTESHVVAMKTDSNNTLSVIVDGVSSSPSQITYTDTLDIDGALYLGSNGGSSAPLFGHIKDFRIYDFALNADEIEFLAGV